MTTRAETALAFIAELRGGGSDARSTGDPLSTVTASGNHHGLVVPAGGTWNDDARPTDDPHRALRPATPTLSRANVSYIVSGKTWAHVAVTPPAARDLMSCVVEALGGGQ